MAQLDHVCVLKALDEIPFGVGKKLLIDFLTGNEANDSIIKNRLYNKECFGSLAYEKDELRDLIEGLITKGMIKHTTVNGNRFWKVMELSDKGRRELKNPQAAPDYSIDVAEVNDNDRRLFREFQFLKKYNEDQKKAIISQHKNILCIAGAGTGKTTVLTKRIEFLVNYKSVAPEQILAITFTRKARQEMMSRLKGKCSLARVETFNSFCEQVLKHYNDLVYEKRFRVITYREKMSLLAKALKHSGMNIKHAIDIYFKNKKGKTEEQLLNIFMNDCYFIRDYFKFKNKKIDVSLFETADQKHHDSAILMYNLVTFIDEKMHDEGLRDFADQMIDTIRLFRQRPDLIPGFEHVLIDEYQDVNSTQEELLDILRAPNMFAVGDPRQSIYGWRGSDIRFILEFQSKRDAEVISLKTNYRSSRSIVELINKGIKNMRLPDLKAELNLEKDIKLLDFETEEAEHEFIAQCILNSKTPRKEIFVMARTNKQLNELSARLTQKGIRHVVKSDEMRGKEQGPDDVLLATVHAIKGMEADTVILMTDQFPCRGSEHPVVDLIKVDEYDKEEEERRLFYVAMSRAKKSLYMIYTGKPTRYLSSDMINHIEGKAKKQNLQKRLEQWRLEKSRELKVPAFVIMNNRKLIEISQRRPGSVEEMQEILGPSKYCEEILGLL